LTRVRSSAGLSRWFAMGRVSVELVSRPPGYNSGYNIGWDGGGTTGNIHERNSPGFRPIYGLSGTVWDVSK
jgi:hypothetical protein